MTGSGKDGPSGGLQRAAAVVVAAEAAGAIPERVMAVEVTPHEDAQAGAGAPPGLLGDLPRHAIGRHDVVELDAPERHEGRARVCGRPAEFGIEAGQELLAQIAIGGGHGGDAGQPEFVDETVLPRAVDPLAAAARLGRVAEDVLDPEPGEGPANLGGMAAIRRAAGRGSVDGPVRAVGIERQGQAVALEPSAQRGHDGGDAFAAIVELGVEHVLGGVVDDGEQREPAVRHQGQPAMPTAVEVEQFAETRARLAAPAVPAARLLPGDQARHRQRLLDEGVAEAHAVLAPGQLMEVTDVEALVAVAVEGEHPLDLRHGRALGRGGLLPAVEQPLVPLVLKLPAQTPDAARTAPEDVGGLQPGELTGDRAKDDLLDRHGALHNATGIGHGHLLGGYSFHAARLARSFHVSLPGGHFTYPQHRVTLDLTGWSTSVIPLARWNGCPVPRCTR